MPAAYRLRYNTICGRARDKNMTDRAERRRQMTEYLKEPNTQGRVFKDNRMKFVFLYPPRRNLSALIDINPMCVCIYFSLYNSLINCIYKVSSLECVRLVTQKSLLRKKKKLILFLEVGQIYIK